MSEKNNLVQSDGLPEFNNLTIEHCLAAIGKQTLEFEAGIKQIEETFDKEEPRDIFKDVVDPIEKLGMALDVTWGISKTLYLSNSSLMPTKSYIAIHDRAKRARANKYNSRIIYNTVKKELTSNQQRSGEHKRILQKFNLEGRLNGLDLGEVPKAQLEENLIKMTAQRNIFKNKIETVTNQFAHYISDPLAVQNLPVEVLKKISTRSNNYLQGPWKATLQPDVYKAILKYCPDRDIRWNIWQATVSRGSGYGNKEVETSVNLEEIRYLRRDNARILGYGTYVDMSMETKMAGSKENVQNMLNTLLESAMPAQQDELNKLHAFAVESGFNGSRIELWDVLYWKHKQCRNMYGYEEKDYKNYFQLPKVLNGLFGLCEKLFDVVIKKRSNVSTWHKDVQYYDVFVPQMSAPVAGFYLDPYERSDDKILIPRSNGWMVGIQNRSAITKTKPLAALVFSFSPPVGDIPSMLSFDEVTSLFQKFGQSLQHLLTNAEYSEVAGVSNIEWDAVEVSGHVLTHWLYNRQVIDSISSHVQTQDKLPQKMFENLINVRKHMAGLNLSRELYLSALDLELHSSKEFWLNIIRRLWPEYRCFPLDKIDSHPCSFTQIFTEDWAAAYYSHVWSRVVAADVYSAFHEVKENNEELKNVGRRYKDTYLALGGSCHSSDVFRKFRGRDPSPKALLKSLGLEKAKVSNEA